MDAVSYSLASKQAQRIEKFIENPDSTSGIVTVPKVIASGETITIPAGRVAILPNVQIDGVLNVEGEVFIPSGATLSSVVEKVTSTDNAIVRFDGTTGAVQNSGVIVDDNNDLKTTSITIATDKAAIAYAASNMKFVGLNTDTIIGNTGAFSTKFYTNSSERMKIDSVGNVGIGTSSPATNLHIQAATQVVHRLSSGTATTDLLTTQDSNGMLRTVGAHPLILATNNTERLHLAANGDFHIRNNILYMGSNDVSVLYSDANWGLLYKALRPSPTIAEHAFFKSDGATNLFNYTNTSGLTVNQPTGLGYGTGSGGTVTQLTSKSTAVTLNKPTGQIVMNNAGLGAGAKIMFVVNNNLVTDKDTVVLSTSGFSDNNDAYTLSSRSLNGLFTVRIINTHAVVLAEQVILNFAIIKGANS